MSTEGWAADFLDELLFAVPAAEGDVWRMAGRSTLLGYVLTCPQPACPEGVHPWTHGSGCPRRRDMTAVCKFGARPGQDTCWTWSGSPEAGDLTAVPSLHVPLELGGCGAHFFLTAGQIVPA